MAYGKWIALLGGVVAVIGQFVTAYYLAAIGGVVAVVGALMSE
jgi:hypothetical protein